MRRIDSATFWLRVHCLKIFAKNWKIKFKLLRINVFNFVSVFDKMAHISQNEFEKLNWLPISDRINQCILSTTLKSVIDIRPNYLNEVFQWAAEGNRTPRNDYLKAPISQNNCWSKFTFFFRSLQMEQISIESTKKCNNINTFKHNFKKLYLAQLAN